MAGRVYEVYPGLAFENGPKAVYEQLVGWLGLEWCEKDVCKFIDTELWTG